MKLSILRTLATYNKESINDDAIHVTGVPLISVLGLICRHDRTNRKNTVIVYNYYELSFVAIGRHYSWTITLMERVRCRSSMRSVGDQHSLLAYLSLWQPSLLSVLGDESIPRNTNMLTMMPTLMDALSQTYSRLTGGP